MMVVVFRAHVRADADLEALGALPHLDPGVIVTDYDMPQLNGGDFIRCATSLKPGVPIILITGHTAGLLNADEIAKSAPLKSVLRKPFRWRQLADEIVRVWPEPNVPLIRTEPHAASL